MDKKPGILLQAVTVLVSAGMMPLCFAPYGYWPLVPLAVGLLLFAVAATSARRAFYFGLLHGLVAFGLSLVWIFSIFGKGGVPLLGIKALFTALTCLLINLTVRELRSTGMKVVAAATIWTAVEFFRSEIYFLRFPWITPGSAFGPTALSPVLGVYGATFLVVAAAAAPVWSRGRPAGFVLLLCVYALGYFRPARVALSPGQGVTVTVVQNEDSSLETYQRLSLQHTHENPDIIVWPEYALPYDVRKSPPDMAALQGLAEKRGAVLVLGTKSVPENAPWRNTALTLGGGGVLGEYTKARPVHFFDDGVPGTDLRPVKTPAGIFGTPVCFDADYTDVVRKLVANGAQCLVVPTFDAASWTGRQHLQHAQLFRLRAAETGRWLASAASSGVSQFVDPGGNTRAQLPLMEEGVLTSTIGLENDLTFFVRAGWLFPWFTIVGAVLLVVRSAATSVRPAAHQS